MVGAPHWLVRFSTLWGGECLISEIAHTYFIDVFIFTVSGIILFCPKYFLGLSYFKLKLSFVVKFAGFLDSVHNLVTVFIGTEKRPSFGNWFSVYNILDDGRSPKTQVIHHLVRTQIWTQSIFSKPARGTSHKIQIWLIQAYTNVFETMDI
jgi:hypothetical protein